MPRRPRPTTRKPPIHLAGASRGPRTATKPHGITGNVNEIRIHAVDSVSENEPESDSAGEHEDLDEDPESSFVEGGEEEEEDVDVDGPRVAQYVDEEDLEEVGEESEPEDDEPEQEPDNLKNLRNDLSTLPLGALRKAQQALLRSKVYDDEDDEDGEGPGLPSGEYSNSEPKGETSHQAKDQEKEKKEVPKRKNKHAPMEMSSKRPVPRKRLDIPVNKPVPRDPRFLPITGEFSQDRFRTQYGFLSEMHEQEMNTLKENLKRARKMLASSPRALRAEREAEVQRLERAVKRAESLVNRGKREQVEASVLAKARKEEKEKQKQGKKAWFMKNVDKKELLTRAKFEVLAEQGGRGAVRKAIEKKQKKTSQKEKKRRPYAPGEKRPSRPSTDVRPNKRQKFS
ncbi:uncharacterized protein PHACADRAFT_82265 [Phanerochaete carnosa HHB-10118-sp]|uniref:rRNA biogenesis protein RRP36 n=1 Tax=Phanerochaete carnosa (strain HHB-10118-sp) TaxID=650164 RepID=K5WPD1_PHACS|nr:uncharacterized protein PHACADRAFT_82265 [Phanerochaete carnosa HHB-10118-sp]EKM61094.1 hypothetical protein PHACADRAFT_82265 [Phanerochaete carnosa HHB-10118-sp]